jgi:CheY-like chemotaxis protein
MTRPLTEEKVNILLVDDQPGRLLSYQAVLKDLDENLIAVDSARAAMEQLCRTSMGSSLPR